MSHITDEITEYPSKKRNNGLSFLQGFFLVLLVLLAAIYMGETLFGKNSLEVLMSLKRQQQILERKIEHISKENAILQKKYFELRSLMPEQSKEDQKRP